MPIPKSIRSFCVVLCLIYATVAWGQETNAPVASAALAVEAQPQPAPPPAPHLPHLGGFSRDQTGDILKQVLVPIAFFAMIAAIVATCLFAAHRKNQLLHETIRSLVEKGQPIPPELLQPAKTPRNPANDFGRALVFIGVGLGLVIFLAAQGKDSWGVGMIPILVGVAYLIVWKIEANKRGRN